MKWGELQCKVCFVGGIRRGRIEAEGSKYPYVCCSVLKCAAVCCSVLQWRCLKKSRRRGGGWQGNVSVVGFICAT